MNNPFSLTGQNIVVTGASSGIGKQCAISCGQMGANVFLIARNEERLQLVQEELVRLNVKCAYYVLDLLDFAGYESVVKAIVADHGKISGFVHSAGMEATVPLNALKVDKMQDVFNCNTFSFFEMVRLLSKKKYASEQASFVAIASVMSFLGQKGKLAYCASKAALANGVKELALELANKNIRVNCVSPAVVNTPLIEELFSKLSPENKLEIEKLHPLGFGEVEDVANACVFLLSSASKWTTGSNLIIDGGYSIQ